MPSVSEKQARTMAAAAHDPSFAKKVGIPTSVAKDFNKADAGTGIIKPKKARMSAKEYGDVVKGAEKVTKRLRKDTDKDGDAKGPDKDKDGM